MTKDDKEITALAREYAEEIYPHEEGEDLGQMEFLRTSATKHIEASLKMLSRRYCLVEKSKVEQMYKEAADGNCKLEKMRPQNTYAKNSIAMRIGVNFGCVHTLKSLFPEIGKEVES